MDTYPAMSSWRWKVGTRLKMFRSFSTNTTICSRRTTALSQVIWGNMDACYSSLFICIKYGLPFSLILQSDKHIGPCRSLLLKPIHLYQVWSTFSLILQSDKHIGCHQCLLLKPSLSHQVQSTFSLIWQSDTHRMSLILATQVVACTIQSHMTIWGAHRTDACYSNLVYHVKYSLHSVSFDNLTHVGHHCPFGISCHVTYW